MSIEEFLLTHRLKYILRYEGYLTASASVREEIKLQLLWIGNFEACEAKGYQTLHSSDTIDKVQVMTTRYRNNIRRILYPILPIQPIPTYHSL
ncbi:hypothetical protein MPER_12674 [Moniliophthora perniciosa FA553]|nr:hypothetical protein MPER_12674 [Moniliophthora perniciosa FA553]